MKKLAVSAAAGLVVLASLLLVRTLRFASKQVPVEPILPIPVDRASAAVHLARAIQFRTVSQQDPAQVDAGQFAELHRYLEQTFPTVHRALSKEVIADRSLLFTWHGRSPQHPVLLMAHLDVVPVEEGTAGSWTYPAFGGTIADGYVWGRGALDDKASVLGVLEAAETLLRTGFEPSRTVYFAFGHDEEVGGHTGAAAIAALLGKRGVAPEFVLDEGGSITEGIVPNLPVPMAMVGVGEKGYASVELTVEAKGGHSSMPPPHTAVGILSAAIERLEANPVPANVDATLRQTFEYLGPEMAFPARLVLANLWLFGPLVERRLAATPAMNAAMRTTTAVTMCEGGVKENVLPSRARGVVNFRILPGDTVATVEEHVRQTVADPRVQVRTLEWASDPSAISPVEAASFRLVQRTIRQVFPGTVVAPSLVLGATDARHYQALSENIYRFVPFRLTAEDLHRIHGTDERISVEDYAQLVAFYIQLLRNVAG